MTPVKVETQTQQTTRRTMELTAEQVENIVRRWAIKNHGFTDAVEAESHASFDGLFSGITLEETQTTFLDSEDTPVSEN